MKAGNGFRWSASVLQVRVTAYSLGLHLTRLSPDSADEAKKREEDHDKPLSED